MKLSTKGRYGMVALADLAFLEAGELASLADISRRQNISLPYLEQLFVKLRRKNLVVSVRGPNGGYRLARPAHDIRVVEILEAVDETVDALQTGAGVSGGVSGSPRAECNQSPLGGFKRAGLCLSASNPPVRCGGQHVVALSGCAKSF
jgi:Rrf2 family iron-sulfur cluster assembly transcriptional regulator